MLTPAQRRAQFVILAQQFAAGLAEVMFPDEEEAKATTPTPSATKWLSLGDYCHVRGVSVATGRRLVRDGMPVLRIGESVRVDPAAADAWHRGRDAAPKAHGPTPRTTGLVADGVVRLLTRRE